VVIVGDAAGDGEALVATDDDPQPRVIATSRVGRTERSLRSDKAFHLRLLIWTSTAYTLARP